MTITRVRLTYHSGRETGGRGDACISGGPHHGVWDLYWKYAGRGGLIFRQGQIAPVFFYVGMIYFKKIATLGGGLDERRSVYLWREL